MSADDPRLVAKYRMPLDDKCAASLHRVLLEHPDHELALEPPFLVVREAAA